MNENKFFNGIPDTIEENLKYLDELGGTTDVQPLPDRLGVGVQHAVQDVEALRELRGRHGRPADRLVAGGHRARGRASAASTATRSTSCRRCSSALGVELPDVVNGYTQKPLEGVSFADDASPTPDAPTRKETQFYSMLGTRAIWHKGWKAATAVPGGARLVGRLPPAALGAVRHRGRPERVPRPRGRAAGEAAGADRAVVGGGRGATRRCRWSRAAPIEILGDRAARSCRSRAPATSTTRAGRRCPESVAPNIRNRSYTIAAEVEIETPEAGGVHLLAGLALRRPRALRARTASSSTSTTGVGERVQVVESDEPIPTGHVVLSASFEREGDGDADAGHADAPHPRPGRSGEATIMTQPGKFGLGGGGLVVGRSGAEPVADDYAGERAVARSSAGTIKRVVIDVSGEAFVDLAAGGARRRSRASERSARRQRGSDHPERMRRPPPGRRSVASQRGQSARSGGNAWQPREEELGPIDIVVIGYPADAPMTGEAAPLLLDLVDGASSACSTSCSSCKGEDGTFAGFEATDLEPGSIGDLQVFEGASSGLLGDDDVATVAGSIEPGTAAVMIMYENRWAAPFAAAVRRNGGVLAGQPAHPARGRPRRPRAADAAADRKEPSPCQDSSAAMGRTAVVAGTATAVSNRVSRRQANRWSEQEPSRRRPQQPRARARRRPRPPRAAIDQLTELGELHDEGHPHRRGVRGREGQDPRDADRPGGACRGGLALAAAT